MFSIISIKFKLWYNKVFTKFCEFKQIQRELINHYLQGLGIKDSIQDIVEENWICQVIMFDWVYLKYDVLKAVAEGGSKRIGGVSGRGPVENNRSVWRLHLLADTIPLCIRRDLQINTSINFPMSCSNIWTVK